MSIRNCYCREQNEHTMSVCNLQPLSRRMAVWTYGVEPQSTGFSACSLGPSLQTTDVPCPTRPLSARFLAQVRDDMRLLPLKHD